MTKGRADQEPDDLFGLPALSETTKALGQIAAMRNPLAHLTDGRFLATSPCGDYARQHTPGGRVSRSTPRRSRHGEPHLQDRGNCRFLAERD